MNIVNLIVKPKENFYINKINQIIHNNFAKKYGFAIFRKNNELLLSIILEEKDKNKFLNDKRIKKMTNYIITNNSNKYIVNIKSTIVDNNFKIGTKSVKNLENSIRKIKKLLLTEKDDLKKEELIEKLKDKMEELEKVKSYADGYFIHNSLTNNNHFTIYSFKKEIDKSKIDMNKFNSLGIYNQTIID